MTHEEKIMKLFTNRELVLSSKDIKDMTGLKDPSGILKELVFFDYLVKTKMGKENRFHLGSKVFDYSSYKNEEKAYKESKSHKYILNCIFTGSHLNHYLGHELINFIKSDTNERFIYINPWGKRDPEAAKETEYVFHLIGIAKKNNERLYQLAAISKVNKDDIGIYDKDRNIEKAQSPEYRGQKFYDIFYCGEKSDSAHVYSFKASAFYTIKDNWKITIAVSRKDTSVESNDNEIKISLKSNPQHSRCYALKDENRDADITSEYNSDVKVLDFLISNLETYFDEKTDENNINLTELDDELCFTVINDRTNLEDSTSNQIAYFLNRDSNLTSYFLREFLGIDDLDTNEKFEAIREKEEIDILIKSDKRVIVIENKIDSSINGVGERLTNGKYQSQLSKYYKFVEEEYKELERKYFVLAPKYNSITQSKLNTEYENGDSYVLKSYDLLFEKLNNPDIEYRPNGLEASELGKFLFSEFKKSIEYISWSKPKQSERTAYIRFKQRLKELGVVC